MLTGIRGWVRAHPGLVLSLLVLVVATVFTSAAALAAPPGEPITQIEQELVDAVNAERAKRNLEPLIVNYSIMEAAYHHTEHMATVKKLCHQGCGDGTPRERIDKTGYKWVTYGENVAMGYPNVAAVMNGWMNSPGHRANILGHYTDIGVAYSPRGHYWTQVFGIPQSPPAYVTVTPPTGHGRPCELVGDFDFDGVITKADVNAVASRFMQRQEQGNLDWDPQYDMVADGVINVYDVFEVVSRLGTRCGL